jgi:hypothetical protein
MSGGGQVHIITTNFVHNGTIRANGVGGGGGGDHSGAGGSIWITSTTVNGSGSMEARGGDDQNGYASGGGGAISIEYTGALSGTLLNNLNARTGTGYNGNHGGPGSIFVKGGSQSYGDLTIDAKGIVGDSAVLPSLGKGIAQNGSGGAILVTDAANNIPAYFKSHYVEITAPDGTLKGSWRIGDISNKTITLVANGNEAVSVQQGDGWQGVYRFDNLYGPSTATFVSTDPIRLGGASNVAITGPVSGTITLQSSALISSQGVTVGGGVAVQGITAPSVRVVSGATLSGGSAGFPLVIDSPAVTVDGGGVIDVTGRGYAPGATYTGATGSIGNSGGSHLGIGRNYGGDVAGTTFGSVYYPQEAGGGAGSQFYGGGALRIKTTALTVDGIVRANGVGGGGGGDHSGAGGSIWITSSTVSGAGSMEARGGDDSNGYASGGGGAISIDYSGALSGTLLNNLNSRAGVGYNGNHGGPGTVYVRNTSNPLGNMTVDSKNVSGTVCALPSLGVGQAQPGSGGTILVTDRLTDIPQSFVGHWVEIDAAAGGLKGTWRISSVNAKTVVLTPNGTEAIDVAAGDSWMGVYRLDNLTVTNATLTSADKLSVTNPIVKNNGQVIVNDGPPQFPTALRSQIRVQSTLNGGDTVIGPIGAVTDTDIPIKLTVTSSLGVVYTANAASNGSFAVPVDGPIGETFTIRATDSHPTPLSSVSIAVSGQITNVNGVNSLTVQPQTVSGASTATAGIHLLAAAHTGGTTVALSSSDPSVTVPSTVVIARGSSGTTFNITTSNPSSARTVTITATTGVQGSTATLTVVPTGGTLTSITINPTSVNSGTTATGTATLASTAPAGGAMISLSSSNTNVATVPATVIIPEGQSSIDFAINTAQSGAVIITGIYGSTQSAPLTVNACTSMPSVPMPASTPLDNVWVDDALPNGATASGVGSWVSAQSASGTQSILIPATAGAHQFAFVNVNATFTVGLNDRLVAYALINPCNPPREILFDWSDGTNEYRASWGEDVIEATIAHTRISTLPGGGVWTRLEVLASQVTATTNSQITATSKQFKGLTIKVYDGEVWIDRIGSSICTLQANAAAPSFLPTDTVWFDDTTPPGVTTRNDTNNSPNWTWDTTQHASGTQSHVEPLATGYHQHYYYADPNPITVGAGDVLYAYVLLDPCNPPREVMLQWNDGGGWEHRAFWGEDATGSTRYRVGALPETGKWIRLEVPAALVGLNEQKIYGMAFTLIDGRAWFDRSGKVSRVNLALNKSARQSGDYSQYDTAGKAVDGTIGLGNLIATPQSSMAVVAQRVNPWWEVDLGAVVPIESVEIRGRTDCCSGGQTANLYVMVSDDPITGTDIPSTRAQSGMSTYHSPGAANSTQTVSVCRTGRYVRIWHEANDVLSLPEVFVWAPASNLRKSLSGGKAASAPPAKTYQVYYPEYAVNGSQYDTYNTTGYIFHTTGDTDRYWQVDLGASQAISTIDIGARLDCCPEQLTSYYVLTSDQPFAAEDLATTLADPKVSAIYIGKFLPMQSLPINRTARYVRLQKGASGDALVLTEVQVWSQQTSLKALSIGKPAVESSAPADSNQK